MTTLALPPASVKLSGPRPVRWTCAEFHRFGEMGMFEGRRAKLIDGVILEEGPMNPPHAVTCELVDTAIRSAFGPGWRIRSQLPLVLGLYTDPLPDFAVIAGSARAATEHPTTANLVIEISDTSLDFDTNDKRLLYATAAIPEYWVADINGRLLFVYRDPQAGDYVTRLTLTIADTVSPLAAPTAVLRVADLLP